MAKRKQQPEPFDVTDFLRPTDEDLKSALNSLLRTRGEPTQSEIQTTSTASGIKLTPGLNLIPGTTSVSRASDFAPTSNSDYESNSRGDLKLRPGPNLLETVPSGDSGINLTPGPELPGQIFKAPVAKRQFPIREMKLAQDAHSRAEQQVYQSLWENARVFDDLSRVITIGFGTMARLVRLSESNARINLRSLIAKLAIEEYKHYICESSVGRTYRVFNYSEILRRRREAGLTWYMRRTLAVVFVNPVTGQRLDLGPNDPKAKSQLIPGLKLTTGAGPKLKPEGGSKLDSKPGPNLESPYREHFREIEPRETSSSSVLFEALGRYGTVDDDVITRLRSECQKRANDCTDEEIAHFIDEKGALIRSANTRIGSPIGFLLTAVPKCLVGESFDLYRKKQREHHEQEQAEHARQQEEMERWQEEQQAILDDPSASEEEKRWARTSLGLDVSVR
jgi:hypothetical protein